LLLRRNGWSAQVLARRAVERDEAAIETWTKEVWPQVKGRRRPGGLAVFRGRGRSGPEAAESRTQLGPSWPDPGGACAHRGTWPGEHRRAGLLPARAPAPADLPGPGVPRRQERAQGVDLDRLPGPDTTALSSTAGPQAVQ
jgi:hypothetical protein